MKATIESTGRLVTIDGVSCRAWNGKTEGGVKFTAFIALLKVPNGEDQSQFARELLEMQPRDL